MKMFSKIMLASLLTLGCMPTTQVRADWKKYAGLGCYAVSAWAGWEALKACKNYFSTDKVCVECIRRNNPVFENKSDEEIKSFLKNLCVYIVSSGLLVTLMSASTGYMLRNFNL